MTTTTSDGIREHELRDALDIHDAEVMHIDRTWVTITVRVADLDRLTRPVVEDHTGCIHEDDLPEVIRAAEETTRAQVLAEIAKLAEAS